MTDRSPAIWPFKRDPQMPAVGPRTRPSSTADRSPVALHLLTSHNRHTSASATRPRPGDPSVETPS
ncbi:hypothetical protein BKA81DRAFT_348533 [Phyllosticta paracitricarpa]